MKISVFNDFNETVISPPILAKRRFPPLCPETSNARKHLCIIARKNTATVHLRCVIHQNRNLEFSLTDYRGSLTFVSCTVSGLMNSRNYEIMLPFGKFLNGNIMTLLDHMSRVKFVFNTLSYYIQYDRFTAQLAC